MVLGYDGAPRLVQAASLGLGSDDAVKAWLNDQLVHANYVQHRQPGEVEGTRVGAWDECSYLLSLSPSHLLSRRLRRGGASTIPPVSFAELPCRDRTPE